MWKPLQNDEISFLMVKANQHEKRYNWKGATEIYRKAFDLTFKNQNITKAAEIQKKIGYSLFRTAFQAETNTEFMKTVKQAVKTYESETELLLKTTQNENNTKINHSKAMQAFARSWLEVEFEKMATLLDEWWKLEKQVLKYYEEKGDLLAIGRICNDMIEGSFKNRFHLIPDWPDLVKATYECISLGEKAIQALTQKNNDYELARAYCWAGWYYTFAFWFKVTEDRLNEMGHKSLTYSKKALELSEKIGDDWLIAWSSHNRGFAASCVDLDIASGKKYSEKALKHAAITRDKHILAETSGWIAGQLLGKARSEPGPEEKRESFRKALGLIRDSRHYYQVINNPSTVIQVYSKYVDTLMELASLETTFEAKHTLLKKAVDLGREFLAESMDEITSSISNLSVAVWRLAQITSIEDEKKQLLKEALDYRLKHLEYVKRQVSQDSFQNSLSYAYLAFIRSEQAKLEKDKTRKLELLTKAISAMKECISIVEKDRKLSKLGWKNGVYGNLYYSFGEHLNKLFTSTKEQKNLIKAIDAYMSAIELYSQAELPPRIAETYWRIAITSNQLGKYHKAAENYSSAAETYLLASEKIPQLKDFFDQYSKYMQAWNHIEQAKHCHIAEKFEEAKNQYEKAAQLHSSLKSWSYLAPTYEAWAKMEEAENLSRNEETQRARQAFQQAFKEFKKGEQDIRTKMREITNTEEKKHASRLVKASQLRIKYCQARINIEEAKALDKKADYNQSSKTYETAVENLKDLIEKIESGEERKELKTILALCEAWQKLAQAEDKVSPETYQEAAELFERVKNYSQNRKTTLLSQGNSSFCRGLSAGTKYQNSLEPRDRSFATLQMEKAATYYLQAGYPNASEYAKATLRLFDAYMYMNNAQTETEPELKVKNYQMAEKLLQIAAGSFIRANQPEKRAQVQTLLERVREEKSLAASLSEVLHAPDITSSTASFVTPTSTGEEAIGLQRFEHADIQTKIFLSAQRVRVGENLCLEVEFLNAGREEALLMKVENIIPEGFMLVEAPKIYRMEKNNLNMKGKLISPLKVEEVKVVLRPEKEGFFDLMPKVRYLNELGKSEAVNLDPLTIRVEEIKEAGRTTTGTKELDALLLGGIPERYAVALTAPPTDERTLLIKNYLEAGINTDQITFQVTTDGIGLESLTESHQSIFYLFLCNPKPLFEMKELPNVYKLQNKIDLTNLNIQLTKTYRIAEHNAPGVRRACIDITSDVLLHYGAEVTRKWISEVISDLKSKNFIVLFVINPLMHSPEQFHAILDLFDGEISLYETLDKFECKNSLRVKKLQNKDYIKNSICLTKQSM